MEQLTAAQDAYEKQRLAQLDFINERLKQQGHAAYTFKNVDNAIKEYYLVTAGCKQHIRLAGLDCTVSSGDPHRLDTPTILPLGVLSALYVGGFHEVYMHVDRVPTGRWWRLLQRERIRVLQLQKPDMVYRQAITGITHFSDISRARAPFLRHAFKGYRDYHGNMYLYNAIMRSYRTYEHYPASLLFEPHFTVFCVNKQCVPTWLRDGSYWDLNQDGGRGYNWSGEALALHMPIPKPVPTFASPRALRDSRDLFGDLGRLVLSHSGLLHVLEEED
ncbi:hypothetical protein ACOMHN_042277 [Nucella lapillus]